ncbi:peptide-methionine (R)-S-oxide reductase MsrB [Gymnodinialimonas ceratoperidinii]|uniref:Peptide-methionine (R)-S-oxide reductase MsrB n=1 Tax=Gymnodinialimonas ceratoperidinii TaxID=2856823 RepID=A0A8F6TUQ4_9RHOB|nr:peptide-methionine (R)-S-oxide reductase MsrB [Gymnodinialimonas ceratoperidinii]QXT38494.1 peptide-methionine (R)-S-oxide reductase MsrB [Gymnodinialimonas ceratoperidinii]
MHRRAFLISGTSLSLATLAAQPLRADVMAEGPFEVTRTEAEWRAILSDASYAVMREGATERAYSSPLHEEFRAGTFHCRGCDLPLYSSEVKYDSGTGWPSFTEALPNAIGTMEDRSFIFQVRTECHCRRCGSHLGHILDDGPPPAGLRHCLNGVSLVFRTA